ncbi:FKBP-type peptidyl-prolyl cis-trans isomerase [Helicobacter cetorum]|uniref:Peptidyl-prolyl cis-trans isomerase n=1 Tax=Helicobacter cetorum (strain ATCC BAA-540 / CCUG 52418 / MIT 99-5656) TaxID=1163745 RepID=I0EU33_HELCM|nr:peptidylprolyl isomerase [Helicobacter cetorum]AFI06452.1 FKBP-type peptidyl-prolyl cis-trans isomerase slyD [Helicobacter cetorum MIT 99-5656]
MQNHDLENIKQAALIEYEVKEKDSIEVLDSNVNKEPLEFIIGANQVIMGLEKAVLKAKIGEWEEVVINPEEAYGIYESNYLQEVPREQFEGIELEKGMTVFGQTEDNQTVQAIIKDFSSTHVMVDYNHPLAGKTLAFRFKVLGFREVSDEEILASHHHHSGGGCCGGHGGKGGGCGCSCSHG